MVAHQSVQLLGNVFLRFVVVVSATIVTSPLQLRISFLTEAPPFPDACRYLPFSFVGLP